MYGSGTAQATQQSSGVPLFAPAQTTPQNSSNGSANTIAPVLMFFILLGLYVVWALVERHEKVQQSVQPHAMGINVRNLLVIVLPVILMIPLLKIAAGKWKAMGLPGGDTAAAYFGSL